ncbi:hypothetical protein HDV57DRAFT_141901 [Trichoderma longibrachiatum]|uniref:Uncharacterized protein n=1 Tax=Trichoderma longibrachiatum ATCC 18648 TaxID=983965 RepID=A0A2T4C6M4_TRILO|nr:hypothetical protein M440DRAFT_275027 [Trichoderma longibrachiatum ATCC 18648]
MCHQPPEPRMLGKPPQHPPSLRSTAPLPSGQVAVATLSGLLIYKGLELDSWPVVQRCSNLVPPPSAPVMLRPYSAMGYSSHRAHHLTDSETMLLSLLQQRESWCFESAHRCVCWLV